MADYLISSTDMVKYILKWLKRGAYAYGTTLVSHQAHVKSTLDEALINLI
jgi:hypothetical protein